MLNKVGKTMFNLLQTLKLKQKSCPNQGQKVQCPFVQDVRNPNKYVCQECGLQCSADGIKLRELLWWIVRGIVVLYGWID